MKVLRKTPIQIKTKEALEGLMKSLPIRDEYLDKREFLLSYLKKVSDEQYKDLLNLAKGYEFIIPSIEHTVYHYILYSGENCYIFDRNIYVPNDPRYRYLCDDRLDWIEDDADRRTAKDIFKSLEELNKQYIDLKHRLSTAAYWEDLPIELFELGKKAGLYDEDKTQEELTSTVIRTLEDDANLVNNMSL